MKQENMNCKERLISILHKQKVDRPAFICPGGMMNMVVSEVMEILGCYWPEAHTDPAMMAELALGTHRLTCIENLGLPFCLTVEAEAMGAGVDLGSREHEPRVISYAVDRMAEIARLPDMDLTRGRSKTCLDAVRILKQQNLDLPIIANLSGPMTLTTSLIDPLVFYRALRREKGAAHLLTKLAMKNIIAFGDALVEAGADVICISDPSATGSLIGKAAFEEFALPYLNEITEHFRNKFNVPAIVHICGDVSGLGQALNEISAEAVSIDSMVGIDVLRKLAPNVLTMGNISTLLLERGQPDELFYAGLTCISKGADIVAPACGISPRTPVKNIKRLAESVINHPDTY